MLMAQPSLKKQIDDMKQKSIALLGLVSMLIGCSMAPPLVQPEVPLAKSYKETAPWMLAQPADELPRGAWWKLYDNAELNALEARLITNSPNLAAAYARYAQAEAYTLQLRSGLFPTLTGTATAQHNRQSEMRPLRNAAGQSEYNAYSIGVQASYEIDLWSRVRNLVASGLAKEQAEKADLESTLLSLQAELAYNYIALRGIDQQIGLLRDTVTAYLKTLELTKIRHDGGIAPGLDVARAQTQYDTAQSLVEQALAQRALAEHAIAALVGASISEFSISPRKEKITMPSIPIGLPSALLQRRPDIAAAERRMAAANASVGVAKAAFFPDLTLSVVLGYQSTSAGSWISAPNMFWAIGPAMVLNLFDAGKRRAQVSEAQAVLDENAALYRAVTISAFQQVEDNLALLNHFNLASKSQLSALAAAKQALDIAQSRYQEGAASYLEVTASQSIALETERVLLDLNTRSLQSSVQLIRALGGGWSSNNDKL
jgi:NodT family efflux transporter outer membrane factor (OMF) lipoprotein